MYRRACGELPRSRSGKGWARLTIARSTDTKWSICCENAARKLRGLLRLVRPVLDDVYVSENVFFRDLSRELSFVRDSQALVEAFDRLAEVPADVRPSSVASVRDYLTRLREEVAGEEEELSRRLEPVRQSLQQSLLRVSNWTLRDGGFDAVEGGLMQNYRRARKAMRHAYEAGTSEYFHEWRKRVKYHWHHARLLRNIGPRLMKPHRRMAAELGELLGQDHDLAVLKQRLITAAELSAVDQRQLVIALIAQRQEQLQTQAKWLGQRLLAEKPRRLAARWRVYWQTWVSESTDCASVQQQANELAAREMPSAK